MNATAVLQARRLTIRRGTRVTLDALDLAVPRGSVYALLGGNGAGKTTTLNALLGFVPAASGQALVDGIAASLQPQQARARLAYLPAGAGRRVYPLGRTSFRFDYYSGQQMVDAVASHNR